MNLIKLEFVRFGSAQVAAVVLSCCMGYNAANTHAALSLQVVADAAQVDSQPVHVSAVAVVMRQDLGQVEVEDVGVQAADLHVILEEGERSEVRLGQEDVNLNVFLTAAWFGMILTSSVLTLGIRRMLVSSDVCPL